MIVPIVEYLDVIGQRQHGEKWRWLAQAVFLARFRLNDMDRALDLANKLAQAKDGNIPVWARNMPVFILNAKGEKQGAYALMLEILKTSHTKLHPEEVNEMKNYICSVILTPAEAAQNPICNIPNH